MTATNIHRLEVEDLVVPDSAVGNADGLLERAVEYLNDDLVEISVADVTAFVIGNEIRPGDEPGTSIVGQIVLWTGS